MLLWLPYFFIHIGFKNQASYGAALYSFAMFAGIYAFRPLQQKFKNNLGLFFLVMTVLSTLVFLILCSLGDDPSEIPIYLILFFMASFFHTSFKAFTLTTDLKNQVQNNRDFMVINSINRLLARAL